MLTKLLTVLIAVGAVWYLLIRPWTRRRLPARPRVAPAPARPVALVACRRCGVFRAADLPCACGDA